MAPGTYWQTPGASTEVKFNICAQPLGVKDVQFRWKLKRVGTYAVGFEHNYAYLAIFIRRQHQEHKKECRPSPLMVLMSIAPQPTRAKAGLEGPSPPTAVGTR